MEDKTKAGVYNSNHRVMVAETAEWIDPDVNPPNVGAKVQALTFGGIHMDTVWRSDSHENFAAYAPIMTKPDWLKKKLYQHYLNSEERRLRRAEHFNTLKSLKGNKNV